MSDTTDLAKAEAARAEAENPDATPTPDVAPEPTPLAPDETDEDGEQEQEGEPAAPVAPDEHTPEGAPPVSQKEIEQVWRKFEKSSQVWRKRVAEIMGDAVEVLIPCPLCDDNIPGYVMPAPDVPERFPAVREFMGDAQPVAHEQDPNTRTCQTCNGWGEVETGSRVQGQSLLACTDCGGKGWQGVRAPVASSGPMAPAPMPESNGQGEATPQGPETPEAAKLRALGYTIIPPVGAPS